MKKRYLFITIITAIILSVFSSCKKQSDIEDNFGTLAFSVTGMDMARNISSPDWSCYSFEKVRFYVDGSQKKEYVSEDVVNEAGDTALGKLLACGDITLTTGSHKFKLGLYVKSSDYSATLSSETESIEIVPGVNQITFDVTESTTSGYYGYYEIDFKWKEEDGVTKIKAGIFSSPELGYYYDWYMNEYTGTLSEEDGYYHCLCRNSSSEKLGDYYFFYEVYGTNDALIYSDMDVLTLKYKRPAVATIDLNGIVNTCYEIDYVLNDGANPSGTVTTYNKYTEVILPTPAKPAYGFEGWYTTEDFQEGTEITSIPKGSTRNYKIYAKWAYTTNISISLNNFTSDYVSQLPSDDVFTITLTDITDSDSYKLKYALESNNDKKVAIDLTGCENLTKVPYMYGCEALYSIKFPATVTEMSSTSCFSNCTNLETVEMPGVTILENYTFRDCSSLSTLVINSSITEIPSGFLCGCTSITSFTIPDGVTEIGIAAFEDTGISSITIPASVTTINSSAFAGTKISTMVIPETVTNLSTRALFHNCEYLTSVTLPSGITSLGTSMFENCTSLQSYTIPDGVASVYSNVFKGCTSLESVTIPSTVSFIYDEAFKNCPSLTEFNSSSDDYFTAGTNKAILYCQSWGSYHLFSYPSASGDVILTNEYEHYVTLYPAFEDNENITSVVIGAGFDGIYMDAFNGCTNLTEVTIPDGVKIWNRAFPNCPNLETINISDTNNEYSTSSDKKMVLSKDGTILYAYPSAKGVLDLSDSGLTVLEYECLSGTAITGLILPSGLKKLCRHFMSSTKVTSLTIPASTEYIVANCFSYHNYDTPFTLVFEDPTNWYWTKNYNSYENKIITETDSDGIEKTVSWPIDADAEDIGTRFHNYSSSDTENDGFYDRYCFHITSAQSGN